MERPFFLRLIQKIMVDRVQNEIFTPIFLKSRNQVTLANKKNCKSLNRALWSNFFSKSVCRASIKYRYLGANSLSLSTIIIQNITPKHFKFEN